MQSGYLQNSIRVLLTLAVVSWSLTASAQQARPGFGVPVQSNVSSGSVDIPQTNLAPVNTAPPAGTTFGPPSLGSNFDPYALNSSSQLGSMPAPANPGIIASPGITSMGAPTAIAPFPPATAPGSIQPSPQGSSLFSRIFANPASNQAPGTTFGPPTMAAPTQGVYDNSNVYGPPASFGGTTYPGTVYPSSTPSSLFPTGYFGNGASGGSFINSVPGFESFQLIQGPRLRHAFVGGGSGSNSLTTNDTDVSVAFAFPRFMYSTQPLYVVPSFSLHLWDGPVSDTAGLPRSAYSAFLDVGWYSDPNKILSTEFGIRVGAFTDFDTFESESIRILGKAIASFRWTPTTTLKAGVIYLDRNSIKLVPAGGIICQTTPYKRYEFFFPQPKFSHYMRTVGTQDVWWYLAGDYGGGSWTVKRADGANDSVDINEIRLLLGLEFGDNNFIRTGRRNGFFEIGWAFEREIEYRFNRPDDVNLGDGFVVRAGIGY